MAHQPPAGWASPASAPRTVFGVPLALGERVIYYRRVPRSVIGSIIVGVILLPFLLAGIFLFIQAAKLRKAYSHANVFTNRRLFTVNAHGEVLEEMPWSDMAGVTYHRQRQGRDYLLVHGRNDRKMEFSECPQEIQDFIGRLGASFPAIDSLPEPFFEPAAPSPAKPWNVPALAAFAFAAVCAAISIVSLVGWSEQLDHIERHERSLEKHSYDEATLRRWIAEAEDEATIEVIKLGVGSGLTLVGAAVGAVLFVKGRKKQRATEASLRVAGGPVR